MNRRCPLFFLAASVRQRAASASSASQNKAAGGGETRQETDVSPLYLLEAENTTKATSLLFRRTYKMGNASCVGHGRRRTSKSMVDPETTSPRIRLSDDRYLAYRETGVPKDEAKFKIIIVHGFGSSKDMSFSAPQELIEGLKIYMVLYDRAGYGESDPNPKRSLKSEALDIEQLADQLQLGPKFYVIGVSMGSYPTWGCLRYIPHRQHTLCSDP